jgi:hypothetical protein
LEARRKLNFEFDPRCPAEDMGKHHPEARGWFRVVGPGEGVLARSVGEKLTQVKFQTASLLDQGGGRGSLNETKYWLRPYSRNFSVPQVVGRLRTILDELAPGLYAYLRSNGSLPVSEPVENDWLRTTDNRPLATAEGLP